MHFHYFNSTYAGYYFESCVESQSMSNLLFFNVNTLSLLPPKRSGSSQGDEQSNLLK